MDHPIEHRNWFPFILVGLTLALAAGVWAWQASDVPSSRVQTEDVHEAPTSEEYQQEVARIVTQYEQGGDVQVAYDALVEVWVPTEAKAVHLDLVIAFGKLLAGDETGQALLDSIMTDNAWLLNGAIPE